MAVAFWNLVGAGLFGFLINPPIALYYMQGLNTTPVHGHTALFGVYGMLGIGLMLFCLRGLGRTSRLGRQAAERRLLDAEHRPRRDGAAVAAAGRAAAGARGRRRTACGTPARRSSCSSRCSQTLVWLRVPGDVIFSIGVGLLAIFVFRLFVGKARSTVAVGTPVAVERTTTGSGR